MLNALNELHPDEHYKFDSKEKELAEFMDHAKRVLEAQTVLAARHPGGNADRVFHMKGHACLAGVLRLFENRPEKTRHGMFGVKAKSAYNVLARFSSGVGFTQHDLKPDVRGLALKIFGVNDGHDNARIVDFLLTNSTNPFANDQEEFVSFMEATVNPGPLGAHLIKFMVEHSAVARLLIKATLKVVPSLASEQYWSGHAYLLGAHQAMKFNVRPVEDSRTETDGERPEETTQLTAEAEMGGGKLQDQIKRWFELHTASNSKVNPDYLSVELRNRLQRGPIKFIFSVQLAKGVQLTPIEDGLVEWKESDSPSIPVAELILDREVDANACRNLRFTPGHFVSDHRPLGNLGRGRIFAYEASQDGRHAAIEEAQEQAFFSE